MRNETDPRPNSPVRLAFSQIYFMMLKLNRELYEIMKTSQARTEELGWSIQLKRLEDFEQVNSDNLSASRWRAGAQLLSAGLTALAGASGLGFGYRNGSAMSGFQVASQLSPILDKAPGGIAEMNAASITKASEDTRMMLDVLKGHMDSMERSGSNHQQDADKLMREAQQTFEAVQRVIMDAERLTAFNT
ncbi:hypothetical protein LMG32289_06174 [Cupriavidus pampae]|uniref:Uncharacterized protein n=2 Tax=Cupriavidus pampae TaxID=659251 RepID=A0ABN7ZJ00_9BURK|nr:hypothetical protein LMG32289_06174 [Cupriavidus pampae]